MFFWLEGLRPIKEVMGLNHLFGLDSWAHSAKVCGHNNPWSQSVVQKRTHVFLPEGLLSDIDQ